MRRRRILPVLVLAAAIAVGGCVFSRSGSSFKASGLARSVGPAMRLSPPQTLAGHRGRLISIEGVSVRLPNGWFGKTAVLPQDEPPGAGLAWLQASNFPTGHLVHGVDAIEAMGAGQVLLTITDSTPTITHVHPMRVGSPLTVSGATRLPKAETPRGHLVLELTPTIRGRSLTIDVDFGSAATGRRLARTVDTLLATLAVRGGALASSSSTGSIEHRSRTGGFRLVEVRGW